MTGNPLAGAARIGWMEFWSHLRSPRLIILAVLLALLVFGVSYGMSQTATPGNYSYSTLNVYPAIRNESGVNHYLVIGWVADERGVPQANVAVNVFFQNYSNPSTDPRGTFLTTLQTNASGWVLYDAGTREPVNVGYGLEYADHSFSSVGFTRPPSNVTFFVGRLGSTSFYGPYGGETTFSLQAVTPDGYPATGASVYLDGNLTGALDANGFLSVRIPDGNHLINITYRGYQETYPVSATPSGGPVYQNGADAVLLNLVGGFMGLILPIVAIAVSFDAIARERAQGSLELLLARRVRREGILVGKFVGAFAAIAVPLVAVLLGGIGVVTALSGRAPTGTFAVAVFGASLFLVAVYVLLMLLFSTLAKSVGTAVVFGVVLWLFFNLIFSFITSFILLTSGGNYFSQDFYRTLLTTYLFDPNLVYQLILGAAVPTTGGGGSPFGFVIPTGYLSVEAILLSAALWVAVPLVLAVFVFRKKAES